MKRGRVRPETGRGHRRHRPIVQRLLLAGLLIAAGFPVRAQTIGDSAERPLLHLSVRLTGDAVAAGGSFYNAQFMPGMPMPPMMQMQMPPMMVPRAGGSQGSMGGGMAMVMTGDTLLEMMAGACTAGLLIGGVAAAAAATPAAPAAASVILSSAGVGCGFAVAATAAGMAGMMGERALYERFAR